MKRAVLTLGAAALSMLCAVPSSAEPDSDPLVERRTASMSTEILVIVPESVADTAAAAVFETFEEVSDEMNEWRAGSPLALVNQAAGAPKGVVVPKSLFALLQRGVALGELTGGAFDITWAALWGTWDFRAEHPVVPDASTIASRVALVDYRRVELDESTSSARLPQKGMVIGLGGIAKGRALDESVRRLRALGVTSGLLSAGGQVYALGTKGDRKWRVGIRDPRGEPTDFFALIEAEDVSVSTSGDYERFFTVDSKRYHHILDPRTGWPAKGLQSATVVCRDATQADALSTAVMVLGKTAGIALAERLDGVEALVVTSTGEVVSTAGLKGRVTLVHRPLAATPATPPPAPASDAPSKPTPAR